MMPPTKINGNHASPEGGKTKEDYPSLIPNAYPTRYQAVGVSMIGDFDQKLTN
jgi:hypothetical protein